MTSRRILRGFDPPLPVCILTVTASMGSEIYVWVVHESRTMHMSRQVCICVLKFGVHMSFKGVKCAYELRTIRHEWKFSVHMSFRGVKCAYESRTIWHEWKFSVHMSFKGVKCAYESRTIWHEWKFSVHMSFKGVKCAYESRTIWHECTWV